MTSETKPQRIEWVDYAKGIGIVLVVLGHVLRGLVDSSILNKSPLVQAVDDWIYAFHIPLFFLISGLFVERSIEKSLKFLIIDKFKTLLYPYFIWSTLSIVFRLVMAGSTNTQSSISDLWKIVYQPVMIYWFLYALFLVFLIYIIFRKLNFSIVHIFIFSTLLYYSQNYLRLYNWSVLEHIQNFLLYFAMGAAVGSNQFKLKGKWISSWSLFLLAVAGYMLISLAAWFNLTHLLLVKPLLALAGIGASIATAVLLERSGGFQPIMHWGRLSLEIYVMHTIAAASTRILLQKVLGIEIFALHLITGIAFGIYAPFLIATACYKFNFTYLFSLRSRVARA